MKRMCSEVFNEINIRHEIQRESENDSEKEERKKDNQFTER